MNVMMNVLVAVQLLSAIVMVGLILLQHGKGADMGAAFGSGSAGSLFGASGSANFLSRTTAVLAAVFFASTLLLAYLSHARPDSGGGSLLERTPISAPATPATPAPAATPESASQIPAEVPAQGGAKPAPAASAPASAPKQGAGEIPAK